MALRFIDSFDHYSTSEIGLKWSSNFNHSISANGRNGTSCLDTNGSTLRTATKVLDSQATWIIGAAFKWGSFAHQYEVFTLYDGATGHVSLSVGGSPAKLRVYRGPSAAGGTLLATGATVLLTGVWYYVELKITISDTVGVVAMQINGATETLTFVTGNATNQDTRNGGNATADTIVFGGDSGGAIAINNYIDDLYICDGSGSSPTNDFLGDVRVQCLFPNGNGNTSNLVGSDSNSTDNYLLVDESTPNSDTDYVESSTVTDKDTYAYGNLSPTTGTVYGVQPCMFAKKTDAGTRKIASIARLSGTEVDSADYTLSASYTYGIDVRTTKPGGGSWSITDVNSAEFGVKVTA